MLKLPSEVMNACTLEAFKARLDRTLSNRIKKGGVPANSAVGKIGLELDNL